MNKKIGILTINDYTNYGNRLQNYALQEVLKSKEFGSTTVETIVNLSFHNLAKKQRKNTKKLSLIKIKNKLNSTLNLKLKNAKKDKVLKFKEFTRNFIVENNKHIIFENEVNNIQSSYDFFVTGSDQVWNPNFRYGSGIDFLQFAPPHKRISYAPSFGISSLPQEYKEVYTNMLNEIPFLSVREKAGANIIYDLTKRNASVLLDPTLLLDEKDWNRILKKHPQKPKGKYLLTYFLGEKDNYQNKQIKMISKKLKLPIINLADKKELKYYSADPSEFLDFIKSSEIFLTDSFHGCVFSIIFQKPFVVFERNSSGTSMNSRIENLLNTFGLKQRHISNWDRIKLELLDVDYEGIDKILERERVKSIDFLRGPLTSEGVLNE